MASIEDVLAYKAMQDEESRLSAPQAAGIGAGAGALSGFLQRGKFGQRMAGAASTAIVGGALGAGMQQIALAESPAARALAKMQSNQAAGKTPTDGEMKQLENALADAYNSQLGKS